MGQGVVHGAFVAAHMPAMKTADQRIFLPAMFAFLGMRTGKINLAMLAVGFGFGLLHSYIVDSISESFN